MPHLLDLSHPVVSGEPGYPGLPAPRVEPHISHAASRPGYGGLAEFEITRLFLVGNSGTYLDSPYHRVPGAPDVAALPLERLAGPRGHVLDAAFGPDEREVQADLPQDIAGAALLIRTGWSRRRGSERYWDPAPYVGAALAARIVAAQPAIVGVDWWNIDDPADPRRPAHTALLAAGIPIVEHLANLADLGREAFRFFAVPAPVRGAASLPVRAFAEVLGGDGA